MVPSGWQLVIIVLVLVLLFGATKLPQMARSLGQSARVFKAETRGLQDDEHKAQAERTGSTDQAGSTEQTPQQLPPGQASPAPEEQTKRNEQTN